MKKETETEKAICDVLMELVEAIRENTASMREIMGRKDYRIREAAKVGGADGDVPGGRGGWRDSIIPFGKYNGHRLAQVPVKYLDWLAGKKDLRKHSLQEGINGYIAYRTEKDRLEKEAIHAKYELVEGDDDQDQE